ncbi:MAG: sigma-70 family RNA polymerase sigma factor [Gilvibacter sp.]
MHQPNHIFDSLLITEYIAGNKKAITVLVTRWHPIFCRQANWYIKDKAVAQDVAQECWVIILKKIGSLKDTQKFAPWALTIVHRRAIDQIRKNKKTETHTSNEMIEQAVDTSTSQTEAIQSTQGKLQLINGGIAQLPLKHRIVIELFYKNQLSLDQIASVLDVSKGTVKSRLFYAREALKGLLKNKNYEN